MKCDVIDHRCQPILEPPVGPRYWQSAANLAVRLFRYRFLRARLFEHAMAEIARREES